MAASVVAEGRGCSAGGTERTHSTEQLALQGILSSPCLPGLSLGLSVSASTAFFCAFIYLSILQYLYYNIKLEVLCILKEQTYYQEASTQTGF